MKTVAVVPVYNERSTVVEVLDRLRALGSLLHEIVIVDDGSTDGSSDLLDQWSQGKAGVTLLHHLQNEGYSEALLTGFHHVIAEMEDGKLSPDDVIATVDADGQHNPGELPKFVKALEEDHLDVVWAQRDFSLYPFLKRLGNGVMSIIASVFAGFNFHDVESGYCLFRIGALKDALRFHNKEHRYSISLTLAITFVRLGYRMSNDPVASIKLYRSRTRVLDVLVDTWAAMTASLRVTQAQIRANRLMVLKFGMIFLTLAFFLAVIISIAIKPIYLGYDSINNYAHVWYISSNLQHWSLPLHFQNLENGNALTFPYGFVPWALAALFYPVLGDFAVTWTMVLGVLLLLFVVYRTRFNSSIWLLGWFMIIPPFFQAIFNFQMSFVWGMLFGYLYVYALEKRAPVWALVLLLLSASTHLLIMGPTLAVYNLYHFWRNPDQRRTVALISISSLFFLIPLAWYTTKTPAVTENSRGFLAYVWAITIVPRTLFFLSPFILVPLTRSQIMRKHAAEAALVVFTLASTLWLNIMYSSIAGLHTKTQNVYRTYLRTDKFNPGAVYRLPEPPGREQGQYFFIQHGAVLANEFFPESEFRQEWTGQEYISYLTSKNVDYVVMSQGYVTYKENESQVLKSLQAQGLAQISYDDPSGLFKVYDVRAASGTSCNM